MAKQRLLWGSIIASGMVHALPAAIFIFYDPEGTPQAGGGQAPLAAVEVLWAEAPAIPSQITVQQEKIDPAVNSVANIKKSSVSRSLNHASKLDSRSIPAHSGGSSNPERNNQALPTFCNQKPEYPEEARLLGIEGTVTLEITLSPQGKVIGLKSLEPKAHPILEKAAQDQVQTWQFPASDHSAVHVLPIKFELE